MVFVLLTKFTKHSFKNQFILGGHALEAENGLLCSLGLGAGRLLVSLVKQPAPFCCLPSKVLFPRGLL